jgi:hypothetical protein
MHAVAGPFSGWGAAHGAAGMPGFRLVGFELVAAVVENAAAHRVFDLGVVRRTVSSISAAEPTRSEASTGRANRIASAGDIIRFSWEQFIGS